MTFVMDNMDDLNKLETELLKAIIEENKQKYPYLQSHFEILKVKNREFTGVGSYTHFQYPTSKVLTKDTSLSSTKRLMIDGLVNELSYELNLTDGKMDFLEIVTNGSDEWGGKAESFKLV